MAGLQPRFIDSVVSSSVIAVMGPKRVFVKLRLISLVPV
jgi:hypothetical protein